MVRAVLFLIMLAVLNPGGAAWGQEPVTTLPGRCRYSDAVLKRADDTALVECDSVTIERNGGNASLAFRSNSWGLRALFSGSISGNRMRVNAMTLRDGRSTAASGDCEIMTRDDGRISAISCLAKTRSRWLAADFAPSR